MTPSQILLNGPLAAVVSALPPDLVLRIVHASACAHVRGVAVANRAAAGRCAKQNPADQHLANARRLLAAKQYAPAVEEARMAVGILSVSASNPQAMAEARRMLAQAYYKSNQHREALEQYRLLAKDGQVDAASQKILSTLEQEASQQQEAAAKKDAEKLAQSRAAAAPPESGPEDASGGFEAHVKAAAADRVSIGGNFGTVSRRRAYQDPEFLYTSSTRFSPADWRPQAGEKIFISYAVGDQGFLHAVSVERLEMGHHHLTGYTDNGCGHIIVSPHNVSVTIFAGRQVRLFDLRATQDVDFIVSGFMQDRFRLKCDTGHLRAGQSTTVYIDTPEGYDGPRSESDMVDIYEQIGCDEKVPVVVRFSGR